MNYWTLFLNAGASALGGSVTALVVIGFFGKYLFDNWFKKDYRTWELEREKSNKEDFARFEGKLDALNARDETRFEQSNPERIKTILEVYRACIEILQILKVYGANRNRETETARNMRARLKHEIQNRLSALENNSMRRIYFNADFEQALRAVTLYSVHAVGDQSASNENWQDCFRKFEDAMTEIDAQVKSALGEQEIK